MLTTSGELRKSYREGHGPLICPVICCSNCGDLLSSIDISELRIPDIEMSLAYGRSMAAVYAVHSDCRVMVVWDGLLSFVIDTDGADRNRNLH